MPRWAITGAAQGAGAWGLILAVISPRAAGARVGQASGVPLPEVHGTRLRWRSPFSEPSKPRNDLGRRVAFEQAYCRGYHLSSAAVRLGRVSARLERRRRATTRSAIAAMIGPPRQ
jgi:hypothetical protein